MQEKLADSYSLSFAGVRVVDDNGSSSVDRMNYSVLSPPDAMRNNSSDTMHDNPHIWTNNDQQLKMPGSVILGILLSIFVIFALAGNLLVIVAITTDRHLRQSGNYFLVSLAIADMLVAVAVMTFAMANDILGRWVFGPVLCNFWLSADVMCSTASILSLCSVSLDRYVHIRDPLHYERWVTNRRALVAIGVVWALSAFISFLPIHLGWHRLHTTPDQQEDNLAFDTSSSTTFLLPGAITTHPPSTPIPPPPPPPDPLSHCVLELNPLYAVLSSMISFYVPCLAMTIIYLRMYSYAKRHAASIKRAYSNCSSGHTSSSNATITISTANAVPGTTCSVSDRDLGSTRSLRKASLSSRGHRVSDHKAAITLGIIMGVFLVCWAPFFTINVVGAFCRKCFPPVVFSVFTWLGYVNSTMNPVIYSIFNRQFREAFKRVLISAPRCASCCHRLEAKKFKDHGNGQVYRRHRANDSNIQYFTAAMTEDEARPNLNGIGSVTSVGKT